MSLAIEFGLVKNVSRNIYFQPEPQTNSQYSQRCCVWDIRKTREELADEVRRTILFVHAILNSMCMTQCPVFGIGKAVIL